MTEQIHVQGSGGQIILLDLPLHPDVAKRLEKGLLRRVKADGSLYVEGERPVDVPDLPDSRPAVNDQKGRWVGWAVVNGMTVDDAEALTKTDLIERFGQTAPVVVEPSTEPEPPVES